MSEPVPRAPEGYEVSDQDLLREVIERRLSTLERRAALLYGDTTEGEYAVFNANGELIGATGGGGGTIDGSGAATQIAYWTDVDTIAGSADLTWDGTDLTINAPIFIGEQAAADADVAGFGQLWVKSDTPNNLYYTDDAGNDYLLNGAGGGNVSNTGTPVDNQIAVWTAANVIEGTSGLTYDGIEVQVGGASVPVTTPTSDEGGVAYFDSYGGPPYTLNADGNFIYVPGFAGVKITNEPLTITGNARKALNLQADGGEVFNIMFETESGTDRWAIRKTSDAETGSNAGSDLAIYNYNDGGTQRGHVFYAERDTDTVYIGGSSGLSPDANADNLVVTSRSGNAGMTIMSPDNLADSYLYFGYFGDSNMAGFIHDSGQNTLSVRVDDVTRYVFGTNGFKVREATAADADTTGFGQFWVKNDTPNTPMFTDDSGNDYELATTTGGGAWINIELDFSNNTITGTKAEFDTALSDANFVFDDEPIPTPGYIVSTLPTPAAGMIAHVTDATGPSIGATVVGGGSAYALVTYNGSNWTVIGV